MKVHIFFLFCTCGLSLQAMDTGYPDGFMADCPGMNYSTSLSEETKRTTHVVIVLPTNNFFQRYRYIKCQVDDVECVAKHLDFQHKVTKVFVSGYLDSTFFPILRAAITQYADTRNVIVLETFPILVRPYPLAARMTKPLGVILGQLLASLIAKGLSSSHLEMVGASLGAHIASYAALEYYRITGKRPARITGLDPAGPCFRNLPETERLHAQVAEKVDVLHTNIDGFGIADPSGHVDFYANGGEFQPSIKGNFIFPCFQLCSHIRSGIYYLLSNTNPEQFVAVRCDSVAKARHGDCYDGNIETNIFGPHTDFNRTGIFYLPTDASPPYYRGLNGLQARKYGVNDYLLKTSPDDHITL